MYNNWLLDHEDSYRYSLLDRLRCDCLYFLGNWNRYWKQLWAGNVPDHIEAMKILWNSFAPKMKPEWLSWEDILKFESDMADNENNI